MVSLHICTIVSVSLELKFHVILTLGMVEVWFLYTQYIECILTTSKNCSHAELECIFCKDEFLYTNGIFKKYNLCIEKN